MLAVGAFSLAGKLPVLQALGDVVIFRQVTSPSVSHRTGSTGEEKSVQNRPSRM